MGLTIMDEKKNSLKDVEVANNLLNKKEDEQNEENLFDNLMESIGNDGKFQSRFNLLYNLLFVIIMSAPYLNIVLAMTIPNHWCHVPGRENTTMTPEEWRNNMLPMDISPQTGASAPSSCYMYNETKDRVTCDVYEYDKMYWKETAASQENWVCDKELYVTNTFVAGRIGEIIGTCVFGQLGDTIGRRPVFYIALVLLVGGRTLSAFTSHIYYLFLATILVGSTATTAVFQSPIVISMEVSASNKRSQIPFLHCVGWVLGLCWLDFIAWWSRDWAILMVASTLPAAIPFITYKLLPESPRWLASRGKVRESAKTLEYICKINGTTLPDNTLTVLQKIGNKKEKVFGIASIFSSWRLAKNSMIMVTSWVICGLTYYVLVLNVTNMAGDPFLNFLWQSVAELPGYIAGRILSEKLGRRWTQSGALCLSFILSLIVIFVHNPDSTLPVTILASCIKLCCTCSFYMVWLQAMEIYPTCVRQTGTSLGGMVANIAGILGPYVVYMGTSGDARIPYVVLCGLALIGAVLSSFLPETYNKKLPETLEEAQSFGKDQGYFTCVGSDKNEDS